MYYSCVERRLLAGGHGRCSPPLWRLVASPISAHVFWLLAKSATSTFYNVTDGGSGGASGGLHRCWESSFHARHWLLYIHFKCFVESNRKVAIKSLRINYSICTVGIVELLENCKNLLNFRYSCNKISYILKGQPRSTRLLHRQCPSTYLWGWSWPSSRTNNRTTCYNQ